MPQSIDISIFAAYFLNFVYFFLLFYSATYLYRLWNRLELKDFVVSSPENQDLICLAVYSMMLAYVGTFFVK